MSLTSRRCILLLTVWFMAWAPLQAHVGSPFIVFEGKAGRIPLRVVVRQPDVIPGLADISVRILEGTSGQISVLPVHSNTDRSGAPRPDVAHPVAGDPQLYNAALWLMTRGAYGIEVKVDGDGGGTVVVPVNSVAYARKPMPPILGWIMALLGAGLAFGFIGILVAAARESTLGAGENPSRRSRIRAVAAGALGSIAVAGMLYGGAIWWGNEDRYHDTRLLHRPWAHEVRLHSSAAGNQLELKITDPRRRESLQRLVPDHGKLVHLFLVGPSATPGVPAMAHLHPVLREEDSFTSTLPPLPPGEYRVFAELAHEGGFTQTLTNRLVLPAAPPASPVTDPDDSWAPAWGDGGMTSNLPLGLRAELQYGSFRAGEPVQLRVSFTGPDGQPARLQPFLRMLGHAAVLRDDGSVFAHLHPAGTLSMAATRMFAQKLGGDVGARTADANCGDLEAIPPEVARALGHDGIVQFPYVFPQPGRYSLWCQVRTGGTVVTAPFAIDVAP